MSETIKPKPCRFVATDEPRAVKGEHTEECGGGDCAGCLPCPHRHCVVDGHRHTDDANPNTCPSCVGDVRDDLEQVADMHARLLTEAVHRGSAGDRGEQVLGGDAMVMLAMTHREQTGLASDGDHSHEREGDPVPPLLTLATWEDAWRDHLGHAPAGTADVAEAAGYLALVLTRMAQDVELPFEDFARDIRQTRGALEDVLHDGERDETGAPCPECSKPLVRRYGRTEAFDTWVCQRRTCGTWYTDHEYRMRVTDDYRANADRLTANDIEAEYRVPAGTVRQWAARQRVRRRGYDGSGRQLYDVKDVLQARDERATA